jgi:hypothetical protein
MVQFLGASGAGSFIIRAALNKSRAGIQERCRQVAGGSKAAAGSPFFPAASLANRMCKVCACQFAALGSFLAQALPHIVIVLGLLVLARLSAMPRGRVDQVGEAI